jgi:hypothetical protein
VDSRGGEWKGQHTFYGVEGPGVGGLGLRVWDWSFGEGGLGLGAWEDCVINFHLLKVETCFTNHECFS